MPNVLPPINSHATRRKPEKLSGWVYEDRYNFHISWHMPQCAIAHHTAVISLIAGFASQVNFNECIIMTDAVVKPLCIGWIITKYFLWIDCHSFHMAIFEFSILAHQITGKQYSNEEYENGHRQQWKVAR